MGTLKTTESLVRELSRVDGKAEIVHGQIVHLPMAGCWPSIACGEILFSLHGYAKATERGCTFGSCAGFLVDLPHRKSFCPDTGYYVSTHKAGMGFFVGAPVFAVEIRNEEDCGVTAEREMAAKRADYFAAGTLVVWDVDLLSDDVVRVYRNGNAERPAVVYRRRQVAEAEPAAPGWSMPVDDLFAE